MRFRCLLFRCPFSAAASISRIVTPLLVFGRVKLSPCIESHLRLWLLLHLDNFLDELFRRQFHRFSLLAQLPISPPLQEFRLSRVWLSPVVS